VFEPDQNEYGEESAVALDALGACIVIIAGEYPVLNADDKRLSAFPVDDICCTAREPSNGCAYGDAIMDVGGGGSCAGSCVAICEYDGAIVLNGWGIAYLCPLIMPAA
jgi:hypothetical protein